MAGVGLAESALSSQPRSGDASPELSGPGHSATMARPFRLRPPSKKNPPGDRRDKVRASWRYSHDSRWGDAGAAVRLA